MSVVSKSVAIDMQNGYAALHDSNRFKAYRLLYHWFSFGTAYDSTRFCNAIHFRWFCSMRQMKYADCMPLNWRRLYPLIFDMWNLPHAVLINWAHKQMHTRKFHKN